MSVALFCRSKRIMQEGKKYNHRCLLRKKKALQARKHIGTLLKWFMGTFDLSAKGKIKIMSRELFFLFFLILCTKSTLQRFDFAELSEDNHGFHSHLLLYLVPLGATVLDCVVMVVKKGLEKTVYSIRQ